jgi:hypothetical protein
MMLSAIPLPYRILGALVALGASYWLGVWQGHKAERVAWEAVIAKQKAEAATKLAESYAEAAAVEQQWYAQFNEVEHDNAKARDEIERLAKRLAAAGRLRDPRRGDGGGNTMPADSTAPGSGDAACPGDGVLSDGTSADLRALAERADRVSEIARACQSTLNALTAVGSLAR